MVKNLTLACVLSVLGVMANSLVAQALDFKFSLKGTNFSSLSNPLGEGTVTGVIQGLQDNAYSLPTRIIINKNSLGIPEGTVLVKPEGLKARGFAVENGKVLWVEDVYYGDNPVYSSEDTYTTKNKYIIRLGEESYGILNYSVLNLTNGRKMLGIEKSSRQPKRRTITYTPVAAIKSPITTSLYPTDNDKKCDLKVVFFLGFDGKSRSNDREDKVAAVDGMGALQSYLQKEILNYPNVSLNSQVYRWDGKDTALADTESSIESKTSDIIVIIGHSFGADTASSFAKTLISKNINVDMLIQIDTVGYKDDIVLNNVSTRINYYQTNDKTTLVETNIPNAENINANAQFDKTLVHTTIDDNKKLHQDIVNKVLEKTLSCSKRGKSAN